MCRNKNCHGKANDGSLCEECRLVKRYHDAVLFVVGLQVLLPEDRIAKVHEHCGYVLSVEDNREESGIKMFNCESCHGRAPLSEARDSGGFRVCSECIG